MSGTSRRKQKHHCYGSSSVGRSCANTMRRRLHAGTGKFPLQQRSPREGTPSSRINDPKITSILQLSTSHFSLHLPLNLSAIGKSISSPVTLGCWGEIQIGTLMKEKMIEKPLDGNRRNIHPKSSDFVDSGILFVMASDMKNVGLNFVLAKVFSKLCPMKMKSVRTGFTMIELLLVLGIIAILAAIVIIAINPERQFGQSEDARRAQSANQLEKALYQYLIDHEEFPGDRSLPEGSDQAVAICRASYAESGGSGCINLD